MNGDRKQLLQAVTKLAATLPPEKTESLAAKIIALPDQDKVSLLGGWSTTPAATKLLKGLVRSWESSGIPQLELAGMLLGASHAYQAAREEEKAELVWTGPATGFLPVRHTEQALLEVIQAATKELFIVSFVAKEVPSVVKALTDAIGRGVAVSMLIESSKKHGGQIDDDNVSVMRKSLPGAAVFVWSGESKSGEGEGYRIVHAKCAVADGRVAFITSANLTKAALEKNMEVGILVRGERLPEILHRHLKALVATKTIV